MIKITAGEQVLLPAHKPGWVPVVTLPDLQALASELPERIMQTIGLLITEGAEGMIAGGELGEPEPGRIPIRHLAGVQAGRPIVYADPDGQLYAEPIPFNISGADQWITVYARRVDVFTEGERVFREDSLALAENAVTDTVRNVQVRRGAGVEIAFDVGKRITEGKAGYLRLGYARLPAGTDTAQDAVSTAWAPLTAARHREMRDASGAPVFDHPAGSVTAAHLAPELSGGFIEGADIPLQEISAEIAAAQGGLTNLAARIDRLFNRSAPSRIIPAQPDLIAMVSAAAEKMFPASDENPALLNRDPATGKFSTPLTLNTDAAAKAAGALVLITEAHNTPHNPSDPETRAYWGDWESASWGPDTGNPPWTAPPSVYHEPADPEQGPIQPIDFPADFTADDLLRTLFVFPSFSTMSVLGTPTFGGALPTWQHNIGRIFTKLDPTGDVHCFFESYRTQDSHGPIMEDIYVQRHQAQYMFAALGLTEYTAGGGTP